MNKSQLAVCKPKAPGPQPTDQMADLVTRVLYRLRFMGEQRPFDKVSLLYILPLVFCVLEQGGVGKPAVEERDEQVVLSLEFLSFHADFSM